MEIKIREAALIDLKKILNLYAIVLDKGEVLSLEQAETLFKKMQTYPNYKVYIAENEEAYCGNICLINHG